MPPTIRFIQSADKQSWLGLWAGYNKFYARTISPEITDHTFKRFIDPNVRMYGAVAENNGTIQGFIHWYPHLSTSSIQDVVYLHDLFVDPEVRGGGVGKKLIEFAYDWAKGEGVSSVYWHTKVDNFRAQILYEKVAGRTDFVVWRKTME